MSLPVHTKTKDYTTDKQAARELLLQLRDYYFDKGYKNVRFWLEEKRNTTPMGNKAPSYYFIRSNISFNVNTLTGKTTKKV